MALIRLDHVPETVRVNLPLNILLPDPGQMRGVPVRERKVLYLLHGLGEDASAWRRYTSIETVAAVYGLVVVMPSVGRSFYADQPNGQRYFTYLTEELPRYLADVFGLAPKREETFIAGISMGAFHLLASDFPFPCGKGGRGDGLRPQTEIHPISMGGYGAFKAAFHCPKRYGAAASISGALSLEILRVLPNDPRQAEFSHIFGDLDKLSGGEHDPATWLKNAAKDPTSLPRLYIASGRQEDLYPLGLHFRAACRALGIAIDYHEEDGRHDWFFWDEQIRKFLAAVLGQPTIA